MWLFVITLSIMTAIYLKTTYNCIILEPFLRTRPQKFKYIYDLRIFWFIIVINVFTNTYRAPPTWQVDARGGWGGGIEESQEAPPPTHPAGLVCGQGGDGIPAVMLVHSHRGSTGCIHQTGNMPVGGHFICITSLHVLFWHPLVLILKAILLSNLL